MKTSFYFIVFSLFIQYSALSQSCLPEGITFLTQQEIDDFQANYPGCAVIEGDVWIHGYDIQNLNGLSVLTEIGGGLLIDSTLLTNMQGLNNLTRIGEDFQLYSNNSLDNLIGFDALTEITGRLDFSFTGVQNFLGMSQISYLGELETYYTGISSFIGLEGLTSLHGNLTIMFNNDLLDFTGLENIQSLNGGGLGIIGTNISSLSGLDNIESNSIADLWITMNDLLTECDVTSICNYLVSPGGSVNIGDNGIGCDSQEEILEACFSITNELVDFENKIEVYPNPVKNIVRFRSKDQKPITELTIYDQMGQKVIQTQGIIEKIDISEFQDGIYFILFLSNGITYKEKIFKI